MKVSELIAKLQEIEGDPIVLVLDSDDEYCEADGILIIKSTPERKERYYSADGYASADNCVMVE